MRKMSPDLDDAITGCFLAGGAILSQVTKTDIADYDLYPKSKKALLDILCYFMEDCSDTMFIVNITDKAITFKHNKLLNSKK